MADDLTEEGPAIGLRPVTPEDRDFLLGLYAGTRADELSPLPWTDAQKAAFIEMQFRAQDLAYHSTYPEARFLVVTRGDEAIGRLYVARQADEIRVVDISLLPGARGAGIGSRLLADVIAEATAAGLPVRLHVERWNRAKRLYERLGFRSIGGDEVYELMERPPDVSDPLS